jgi:hypothetical protein
MKHFKSLTAILVMLTLVLASCGSQTPINDASSSTDSTLETEALSKDPRYPAPTITITSTSYQDIDLRVETNLAKLFKVTHPIAKSVTLTVTSDKDGVLFDGTWNIDPTLFVPSALKRTFATPGTRAVTVTARVGLLRRTGTFYLNVINTAPVIKLHYDSYAYVNENFWVTAQIFDKNEPDGTKMCANTTWTLDAPNTLDTSTGCQVKLTFSNVFTYQLRVSTHDSEGAVAVEAANLAVLPAFLSPRIIMSYLEFADYGNCYGDVNYPVGSILNLAKGCQYFPRMLGGRGLNIGASDFDYRVFSTIWSLFVTDEQGNENLLQTGPGVTTFYKPFWSMFPIGGGGGTAPVTRDCRMTLKLTSPDGSIGNVTMWVGKCTYNTQKLN